jgi:hypothetical protein
MPSITLVFQAGGEMIETPVVDPCGPPADEARSDIPNFSQLPQ